MTSQGFDFGKLRTAVESSIRKLAFPREKRIESVRQFVGMHYFEKGAQKRVPTNMLELAVTIYVRRLAARSPRAMVTTPVPNLRPFATNMGLALNQIPEEIGLDQTLRHAVIEAIFGIGVVKVGIASTGRTMLGHVYGESFVDLVSLDDYFLDMTAKKFKTIQFEGDDYWIPLDVARDMAGNDKLEADKHTTTGSEGEERAEGVSTDESVDVYGEKVHVRDVWLPDTGQLVTYGVTSKEQFNLVNWDGPIAGPYHKLGFSDVPGNLLPLPPVALMRDLHELGNSLFRKLAQQAEDKKTVAAFQGGQDDDVAALKKAKDGEGMAYHGQKPEQITVGGIDQPTLAIFLQCRDLFSYFAGNLDSLGGLSPVADTVGQEQLTSEAASARIAFMEKQTVTFVKGIYKSLAWYEWTDVVRKRTLQKPIANTSIVVQSIWSYETRDGDFLDYNLDIDVYSMQEDTPATKLQKIGQALERFIFPNLPMIQQQGGQLDFRELMALIAKLANIDELKTLLRFQEPLPDQQMAGNPTPSTMPAHTTRTYERVNRPGATRAGKDDVMSRLLMGGNVQQSEADSAGRMTG